MEPLEKFIRQHVDQLGHELRDPAGSWQQLSGRLDEQALEHLIRQQPQNLDYTPSSGLWDKLAARLDEDTLERTIRQQRDELDYTPAPQVWERIQIASSPAGAPPQTGRQIQVNFRQRSIQVFRAAAAILAIFGLGWWFGQTTPATTTDVAQTTQPVNLREVAPELADMEGYYTSLVSQKINEVAQYQNPEDQAQMVQDLTYLDSTYTAMKVELAETGPNERVISAMAENLMLRIEILNRQLDILKSLKSPKNKEQDHESTHL